MEDRICHRTLLNVGFMPEVSVAQLNNIREQLNNLYSKQSTLFEQTDLLVKQYTTDFWNRLISEKKVDIDKANKQVNDK